MNIREKLNLMKQLNDANNKSIERFLNRECKDADALHAIIRRGAKVESLMREVTREYMKEEDR